ncbi:hypothetical protein M408DRAFT_104599 [Serendipita vermifera MAFF 305830]|uniref:Uncharacterized protein n=1 Tax=Serendipita vermifera MAFF 305830 TaxID=933852 RepID=A0A0C3AMZ9_SERVB|nr:hypothetical protein M408DRAFT_104599 [Serendipita vermifera MAFF 305830]
MVSIVVIIDPNMRMCLCEKYVGSRPGVKNTMNPPIPTGKKRISTLIAVRPKASCHHDVNSTNQLMDQGHRAGPTKTPKSRMCSERVSSSIGAYASQTGNMAKRRMEMRISVKT